MDLTQHTADLMNVCDMNCPILEIRELRSPSDRDIPLVSCVCDPRITVAFHLRLLDKRIQF